VPDGVAGVELSASPNNLALTRTDLPAGFQLVAEKSSGPEYVALYLRPSAADLDASGGNSLLGVLTYVAVYTTTADAEHYFSQASFDPAEQSIEDIKPLSSTATDVVTQPFDGSVQGADASEAYRVTYSLMDRHIFAYSHRIRLANVLAYIAVSAIGNPDEPQYLLEDVRNIVQRQIDYIAKAALQSAPK